MNQVTLCQNLINLAYPCENNAILSKTQLPFINELQTLLAIESPVSQSGKLDRVFFDSLLTRIDDKIQSQLNEVLHHPEFQKLESTWRGLHYLVEQCDPSHSVKIDVINISKYELNEDFDEADDISQTGLFHHVYHQEYDTPGGEPISAIIADYEFDASNKDVELLSKVSEVCALAHCPFISSIGPRFFGKHSIDDLDEIDNLEAYFDKADYIKWNNFRQTENARYIGLTMPRFLLREPYTPHNTRLSFYYNERIRYNESSDFLWGNASYAFAANIARSFKDYGWILNIRGPNSGGKVEDLPLFSYFDDNRACLRTPTEITISENRELELAQQGFIPLSYYKNSDFACFFSANSTQLPTLFDDDAATRNSRINARLPYVFLCSRLAHYLKILQRENIGTSKNKTDLTHELNTWLGTLVTKMENPEPNILASHPLKEAYVMVHDHPSNPGLFQVKLYITPHFQIEGMDICLSLVAQLPSVGRIE